MQGSKEVFFVEPKAELPCSRLQHTDSGKCVQTERSLLSKPAWLLARASNAACEGLTRDNLMDIVSVLEAREAKKMGESVCQLIYFLTFLMQTLHFCKYTLHAAIDRVWF